MARRRLSGAIKLRRLLRRLPADAQTEVATAIEGAATRIFDAALTAMPAPGKNRYATGELRAKFKVKIRQDGLGASVGSFGRRRARHAHLVEFGARPHAIKMPGGAVIQHPGSPAQPFLVPAFKANKARNLADIGGAVDRALKHTAGLVTDDGDGLAALPALIRRTKDADP